MNAERKQSSKGQILVMFAIGLIGLLALGALVVDGGQTFVHRRQAQTAADAAAMAGAYEYCNGAKTNTETTAIKYATENNFATSVNVYVRDLKPLPVGNTDFNASDPYSVVWVKAWVHQSSFLAGLLGRGSEEIPAIAAAGCFTPSKGNSLLPVAWSCKAPIGGSPTTSQDCSIQSLDWNTVVKPKKLACEADPKNKTTNDVAACLDKVLPNKLYTFIETTKVTDQCAPPFTPAGSPPGTIDCDLNNDNVIDLFVGGNRGWLNLDTLNSKNVGGGELKNWINPPTNYVLPTVLVHSWLNDNTPSSDIGVYKEIDKAIVQKGKIALLPVFNTICDVYPLPMISDPSAKLCTDAAHSTTPPGLPLESGESDQGHDWGKANYYHIVGFNYIYITCVHDQQKDACPGYDHAEALNPSLGNKLKGIEGYFITGYPTDLVDPAPGGVDLGVYFPSLTQ